MALPYPTLAGAQLGKLLAAQAENAVRVLPAVRDERCRSCAFRLGTYPNRCWQTVVDAFGCLDNGEPFHCHERVAGTRTGFPEVCAGFLITEAAKARAAR